jgi:hypothetical protein
MPKTAAYKGAWHHMIIPYKTWDIDLEKMTCRNRNNGTGHTNWIPIGLNKFKSLRSN